MNDQSDTLLKHKDLLDENKKQIHGLSEQCTRAIQRVEKVRESAMEEIGRTRDEIYQKVDSNDQFCINNFEMIREHSQKDRNSF